MTPAITTKQALRTELRRVRRAVDDPAGRSARIWNVVTQLDAVRGAAVVMAYQSIPGEPDTAALVDWCRARSIDVVMPEHEPDPERPDVIVVPGLGFTPDGHRLGQGGGWYDRFLARVRPACTIIGVAFHEQVVDELPVEDHDVTVDVVVTDRGTIGGGVRS